MEEEVTALQERIGEMEAEVERLSATAADGEARAAHLEEALQSATADLRGIRGELAQAQTEAQDRGEEVEALQGRLGQAAAKYRDLLLAQAPQVPAELVVGESIEEVEEAMERARRTVAQVRDHLEAQARSERVPAGSPPRGQPDLSALSPAEKIRLGLQRQS